MPYRHRITWRGRRTNRINCPKSFKETGVKVVSFERCRDCEHMIAIGWPGVNCDYGVGLNVATKRGVHPEKEQPGEEEGE